MNYGYLRPRNTPAPSPARRRAQLRQIERQSKESPTSPEHQMELGRLWAVSMNDAQKTNEETHDEQCPMWGGASSGAHNGRYCICKDWKD